MNAKQIITSRVKPKRLKTIRYIKALDTVSTSKSGGYMYEGAWLTAKARLRPNTLYMVVGTDINNKSNSAVFVKSDARGTEVGVLELQGKEILPRDAWASKTTADAIKRTFFGDQKPVEKEPEQVQGSNLIIVDDDMTAEEFILSIPESMRNKLKAMFPEEELSPQEALARYLKTHNIVQVDDFTLL